MVGPSRSLLGILGLVTLAAGTASAGGWPAPSYYCYPPYRFVPLVISSCPGYYVYPAAPFAAPLAVPQPAPPSQTKEPAAINAEKRAPEAKKSDGNPFTEKKSPAEKKQPAVVPIPMPEEKGKGAEKKDKGGPMVVESRLMGGAAGTPKARCKVGFWNLAGKDVTLTVAGKKHLLPRDREVRLDLDRDFAWQVEGRPARNERVPEGQATMEIVIRP